MFDPRAFVSVIVFCVFATIVYYFVDRTIGHLPNTNASLIILASPFVATWWFMDYIWPKQPVEEEGGKKEDE